MRPFSVFTGAHDHRVALQGEIDMSNAPELQAALLELNGDVVIDCSELKFIDSTGLNVLARVHKRLAERGDHLTIEAVPSSSLRVIQIAGLDRVLDLGGSPQPGSSGSRRPYK
jgi:anti-anti-sigma factor